MLMIGIVGIAGIALGWLLVHAADWLRARTAHGPMAERPVATWDAPALVQIAQEPRAWRRCLTSAAARLSLAAEVGSGAFLAALWALYGAAPAFWLAAGAYAFFLLIALIDLKYRVIPNAIVYPAIAAVFALRLALGEPALLNVLVGGGFAFGTFYCTALLRPGQLGFGDVKLALLIGLALGFPAVLWALLLGTGAAGVAFAWMGVRRPATLKAHIPFAPFLCFGAMVALLYIPDFMTL